MGSATSSRCRLPARLRELKDYRVLLIDAHPLCPTASSVASVLDRLAERRSSPEMPDLARTRRLYGNC
jgi:amidase